jgi:hypothetical protein
LLLLQFAIATDALQLLLCPITRVFLTQSSGGAKVLPKQKMEINPKHPIMIGLLKIKQTQPDLAHMVAEQVSVTAYAATVAISYCYVQGCDYQ